MIPPENAVAADVLGITGRVQRSAGPTASAGSGVRKGDSMFHKERSEKTSTTLFTPFFVKHKQGEEPLPETTMKCMESGAIAPNIAILGSSIVLSHEEEQEWAQ